MTGLSSILQPLSTDPSRRHHTDKPPPFSGVVDSSGISNPQETLIAANTPVSHVASFRGALLIIRSHLALPTPIELPPPHINPSIVASRLRPLLATRRPTHLPIFVPRPRLTHYTHPRHPPTATIDNIIHQPTTDQSQVKNSQHCMLIRRTCKWNEKFLHQQALAKPRSARLRHWVKIGAAYCKEVDLLHARCHLYPPRSLTQIFRTRCIKHRRGC